MTESDARSKDDAREPHRGAEAAEGEAGRGEPRAVLKCSWLWDFVRVPVWLFCRLWVRLEVEGTERLDDRRGGLLLINHQSSLDPLLVAVMIHRPVSYLARDSLFRIPLLGWLLRNTHVIPLSREAVRGSSIRTALDRLEQGFLVGIYPEGTRNTEEAVRAFRPGFLALARRTDQPIYPVAIAGSGQAFPRGALWVRPRSVRVVFGPAFSAEDRRRLVEEKDDAALARMAHHRVRAVHDVALNWLRTGQRPDADAVDQAALTDPPPQSSGQSRSTDLSSLPGSSAPSAAAKDPQLGSDR